MLHWLLQVGTNKHRRPGTLVTIETGKHLQAQIWQEAAEIF